MDELFYWLFNMSAVAALTGLVILLLRSINKIPRRVAAILWAIPFLRFWVPFGLGGRYGLMALLSPLTRTVTVYKGRLAAFSGTNAMWAAEAYFPIVYKTTLLADVFRYASIVWAIVAAALVLAMTILYLTTVSELKDAEQLRDKVYVSPKVLSPAVYGIFRPRIVIPVSCRGADDLDLVIRHEKRHVRRGDNIFRVAAFLTAALHWFNPFVWIFLKQYLSDVELACDESVLSELPADERGRYAHALLDARESQTVFASSFGGAKLRTRIERIVSFRKMTVLSAVGFGFLTGVIAYILLTNAA